ncbi:TraM recognition domain-containing protein [bacterium]|nr:TraM recognition domain-containing protein [bacterium]
MKRILIIFLWIAGMAMMADAWGQSNSQGTMNPLQGNRQSTKVSRKQTNPLYTPPTTRPMSHQRILSKPKTLPPSAGASKTRKSIEQLRTNLRTVTATLTKVVSAIAVGFLVFAFFIFKVKQSNKKRFPHSPDYIIKEPEEMDTYRDVYSLEEYSDSDDVVLGYRERKSLPTRALRTVLPFVDRRGDFWMTTMQRMRKNMIIFGSPGWGKSNLMENLAFSYMLKRKSVVIIEPSGDLAFWSNMLHSAHVCGRDADIFEINLLGEDCPTFGLFSKYPTDNPLVVANRICSGVGLEANGRGDRDYYQHQEARFVLAMIPFLYNYYPDADFVPEDLMRFIHNESFRKETIAAYRGTPIELQNWKDTYARMSQADISKLTSNICAGLEPFMHEPLYRIFNNRKPDLNFQKISKEKLCVVFRLPAHSLLFNKTHVGRMIVANLQGIISYRNQVDSSEWDDMICLIDEFAAFAPGAFMELFNQNRKAGISFVLAMQNLAQLEDLQRHNTRNVQLNLLQACRHHLVGQQRDGDEARMWSNRTKLIRVIQETGRYGNGIVKRKEGTLQREVEVREYHPNCFMNLQEWQFWVDLLEDDLDGDVRGSYGQGFCFIPRLLWAKAPIPREVKRKDDQIFRKRIRKILPNES